MILPVPLVQVTLPPPVAEMARLPWKTRLGLLTELSTMNAKPPVERIVTLPVKV